MSHRRLFGRRVALLAAVTALTVLTTACSSLPSAEVMKAETAGFKLPKSPEAGKGMVYVVRPSALDPLVRFNVFLDDKEDASEMGYNRSRQYIFFHVKPGKHTIYSKAENWAEATVDVKPGEVAYLQQDPMMGIIMARNDLHPIDTLEGKYLVKSLTPGTVGKLDK